MLWLLGLFALWALVWAGHRRLDRGERPRRLVWVALAACAFCLAVTWGAVATAQHLDAIQREIAEREKAGGWLPDPRSAWFFQLSAVALLGGALPSALSLVSASARCAKAGYRRYLLGTAVGGVVVAGCLLATLLVIAAASVAGGRGIG